VEGVQYARLRQTEKSDDVLSVTSTTNMSPI